MQQRNRAKKEWSAQFGARIPDEVWAQTRAAFVAQLEQHGDDAPQTLDAWIEQALNTWLALGVRGRKTARVGLCDEPGSGTTARNLRLAVLTKQQMQQAWAADGGEGTLGLWIAHALAHAAKAANNSGGELAPVETRLPTWRT